MVHMRRFGIRQFLPIVGLFPLLCPALMAAKENITLADAGIVGLDFEQLGNIEVTSVSKKEDRVMETAAAVYVITGEEIRRSGVTSLAEALRLAPGMEVARTNSDTWAVSSRGFNSTLANKLLVLIDGRSVYSPLFAGVFWDVQDISLDDVDRIEVIRGPGAAVWGANAVNGVINVIRKPAAETQGGRISAGAGNEERSFGSVRYGGEIGNDGHYRAMSQYFDRDDTRSPATGDAGDPWHMAQGGFRMDLDESKRDSYMVSSDFYSGEVGQISPVNALTPPFQTIVHDETELNGGNAMGRWTRNFSSKANLQLQVYYDRTKRHISPTFNEDRDTYDVDFKHQFPLPWQQSIIWGTGYRASRGAVNDYFALDFNPDVHTDQIYNVFVQDEIRAIRSWIFTLGSRFDHNNYTGLEIQPNARAAWLINSRNTLWGSVSRAVRTPTRFDRDVQVSAVVSSAPLTTVSFRGTDDFNSEEIRSYELGYRTQPSAKVFADLSTFYNVYDNLWSFEPGPIFSESSPAPTHLVVPFYFQNRARGESYGVEFAPQIQLTPWWRLQGQYSYLHLRLHLKEGSHDEQTIPMEGNDPSHQFSVRTSFNLPSHFEIDGTVRYVDNLRALNVPSYTVGDFRVGWRGIRNLNLEVVAQNLFESHHPEFSPGNEIERGYYGRATWDF